MHAYNCEILIFDEKYCLFFKEISILPRFQTFEIKNSYDLFDRSQTDFIVAYSE
jgi:hypothetical protein